MSVDGSSPAKDAEREWRSAMIDVSGMSLSEFGAEGDDSPLDRALRRAAADAIRPHEPIAGFNSAL